MKGGNRERERGGEIRRSIILQRGEEEEEGGAAGRAGWPRVCLRSATQFQEKGGMNNTGNYKDDYAKNSIESPARKGQSISSSPSPLIYANEMYTFF